MSRLLLVVAVYVSVFCSFAVVAILFQKLLVDYKVMFSTKLSFNVRFPTISGRVIGNTIHTIDKYRI